MVDQVQSQTDNFPEPENIGQPPDLPYEIDLSDNARTVLSKRYLRKGPDGKPAESIEEMFWRVAWNVAAPEEEHVGPRGRQRAAERYYEMLTRKNFFPNSPTFTGAGTPLGQLAACFVLAIEDDMGRTGDGIFQTLRNAALIQQTGGGNGFAFSRLRPKGARVHSSNGEATGPVGFLRVYDQAFGEIAQGGSRRGANMGVLRVDHPDIREFITCKVDENAITNFNISVGITDTFMEAVKHDTDYDLVNPQNGEVYETVRAREVFDQIVTYAHHNGEPGMLFLDAANRDNPVPHLYALEATNPCFVGETRIASEFGLLTIAELADLNTPLFVATDNRSSDSYDHGVALRPSSPAWKTREDTPVLTLTTKQGYTVTATPDHRFLTPLGYVELQDLKPGSELLLQSGEGAWSRFTGLPNAERIRALSAARRHGDDDPQAALDARAARLPETWSHELGLVLGWLVGNGWLSGDSDTPVGFGFDSEAPIHVIQTPLTEWFGSPRRYFEDDLGCLTYGRLPFEFFRSLGVEAVSADRKRVPAALWSAPREAVVGFLQGLFTADGTVLINEARPDCVVRLASSSGDLLGDVQVLLSNFGIVSRREGRALVLRKANRDRFAALIGFADDARQSALADYIANKSRRSNRENYLDVVESITPAGRADVYDLTQPQTASLIANGLVAHNCGEQWLGPNENCCLGSINLGQHISADGGVDWEKLRETTQLATRFLDDVVDANAYVPAVPELQIAAHRVRRIGLGIMGLSDLMYALDVRYGSKEGQEFAAQVMEFVHYHCMATSVELARERGSFLAISGSLFDPDDLKWQPPTPLRTYEHDWGRPAVDWQAVEDGIKTHGIRNGAHTTIAPTGTISTVAGVEGYGCEPVFALAYVRYFDDNGTRRELQYTSPRFEKALIDAGIDGTTRKQIVEQTNRTGSCQDVPEVPDAIKQTYVVSSDISAEEHVYMQAAMQRFVSNSISKTCNFPADASEEDVAQAFQLAWDLGCKGLTVYVAGSREKVVLETAETKQQRGGETPEAEKAPAPVIAKPQPTQLAEPRANGAGSDRSAVSPGLLPLFGHEPKKPRGRVLPGYTYRLETPLGTAFITVNENGGGEPFEVFMHTAKAGSETAAISEAVGRLISYILRMRSPLPPNERLKEVVRQLSGIGGGRSLGLGPNRVRSLPDGLAQVLEEYLSDWMGRDHPELPVTGYSAPPAEKAIEPSPGQMALKFGDLCPECGQAAVVNEEGCRKCYACGFSEC